LNAENKPIRVKSITKQAYDGKIYGVDVENDIVLVKHGGENATAFWSGNSESYSQDTFDLRVVGGILEFEHIIDPAEENITNYTASGTFTVPAGVTSITVRAWGGGGGSSSLNKGGSGGGGGQYAEANISVTEGQVFDITIGGGGAAGAQGNIYILFLKIAMKFMEEED